MFPKSRCSLPVVFKQLISQQATTYNSSARLSKFLRRPSSSTWSWLSCSYHIKTNNSPELSTCSPPMKFFQRNRGSRSRTNRFKKWTYGFLTLSAAGLAIKKGKDKEEETTVVENFDNLLHSDRKIQQFRVSTEETTDGKLDVDEVPNRPDLPTFSMKDVSMHKSAEHGIWVTFKSGVYDITEFVEGHPGGRDMIILAAGGSVEPFWNMYAQHKTPEIMEMLEELRIGNLNVQEVAELEKGRITDDPYANDPERHPALLVNSAKPFNAEVPAPFLTAHFFTPNELFFVRNHLPVPQVDVSTYRLKIAAEGLQTELSLDELKSQFKTVTVSMALQCAGNRRTEMDGCEICQRSFVGDVLERAGAKLTGDCATRHVQFEGLDQDATKQCYGASIPLDKALYHETILAFEMNGKPLPKDHGFPLRVIAPGIVGARQVKWLSKITISCDESQGLWQQRDYRVFSPDVDMNTVDYKSAPAIQDAPITSAICKPQAGQRISKDDDTVEIEGYAWSGGGQGIIRVDVSVDGGRNWHTASLFQAPDQNWDKMYAWTLWKAEIPIPNDVISGGEMELVCKATNVSYNTQPESPAGIWNFRGLLTNSWHRVKVCVE